MSTSVGTASKNFGKTSMDLKTTSKMSNMDIQKKANFQRLVGTIMTNPYSASGLNTEKYLAKATMRPSNLVQSRKCKPCRENLIRAKKASLLDRYK